MFSIDTFHGLNDLEIFSSKPYNISILLLIVIAVCVFLPNSLEIVKKIKMTNNKSAFLWGWATAVLAIAVIMKMIVIPYSEFIYFNF